MLQEKPSNEALSTQESQCFEGLSAVVCKKESETVQANMHGPCIQRACFPGTAQICHMWQDVTIDGCPSAVVHLLCVP